MQVLCLSPVLLKNKKQNPQYMYMQLDKDISINPPRVEIQAKQYLFQAFAWLRAGVLKKIHK